MHFTVYPERDIPSICRNAKKKEKSHIQCNPVESLFLDPSPLRNKTTDNTDPQITCSRLISMGSYTGVGVICRASSVANTCRSSRDNMDSLHLLPQERGGSGLTFSWGCRDQRLGGGYSNALAQAALAWTQSQKRKKEQQQTRDEVICTLPSESTLVCPLHYPHLEITHTNELQAAHLKIPQFLLSLEPNIKIPSITMATAAQLLLSVAAGQHVVTDLHEIKSNQTLYRLCIVVTPATSTGFNAW